MPNTGPVFSKTWLTIVGVHENNGLSASISNKKSIEYTFFVHKRSPNKSQRVYHSLLCIILLRVLYHFIRGILSFFLFFLAHFLNIFSINEFRASSTATAVKLHLNFFFFFSVDSCIYYLASLKRVSLEYLLKCDLSLLR